MKAIEKAWEDNLKLNEEDQWKSKAEIISETCPHSDDYNLKLKDFTNEDGDVICSAFGDNSDGLKCARCWESEIEDEKQESNVIESKSTFDKLYKSPIKGIELNSNAEIYFKDLIKQGKTLIHIADMISRESITYDNLPVIIKWLQDVSDMATELKNKVKYVDFNTAKEYMNNKNKAMFENETYYIKNGELYCEDIKDTVALKLRAIESSEWILL